MAVKGGDADVKIKMLTRTVLFIFRSNINEIFRIEFERSSAGKQEFVALQHIEMALECKGATKGFMAIASKEITGRNSILVFDDVVINKSRSQKMELVNW
jgi:hypothetical protein